MKQKTNPQLELCKNIFDQYSKLIQCDPLSLASSQVPINLVHFSSEKILSVISAALKIIKNEPIVLNIKTTGASTSDLIVVGDIHGQLIDLIRIFKLNGLPTKTKYLFLGDLVDRGEFSIDVMLFVLTLKVLFPTNVHILRGNHEFHSSCWTGGFWNELQQNGYSEKVYASFLNIFSYLSICAIIDDRLFATHGGIGPEISTVNGQLSKIQRPIVDFGDDLVIDCLLWSDPNAQLNSFQASTRGMGCMFGKAALEHFLQKNNLTMLIRGHESISQGYEYQFNKLCLTVFSASNYCGQLENDGGIIKINGTKNIFDIIVYPPLPFLMRSKVNFTREKENSKNLTVNEEIFDLMKRLKIGCQVDM